ncbi:hypothetical protein CAPTEDRAFT_185237 [Capitella teleta]|uniref:BRICHOS domain-containing protein n=1 Tax=Capitella teleta TaxID=283909 RepID=R7TSD6_CAPTE|nr:hypothetical protein CAPTEDRAFT_185237 [Capitella teleta]|eukprot:ELT93940.1 hypothetical protein CAPTEDRAFT_185237 [Capitella teleta]
MEQNLVEILPPKYVAHTDRKWTGLIVYAVVMTMVLIATVATGVVLFVRHVDTTVDIDSLSSKVEHFRVNGADVRQRVQLDVEREAEIVRYDDIGAILVLDYRRGLTALYAKSSEECYLVGGIDRHLPSPFHGQVEKNDLEEASEVGAEVTYRKSTTYPVMDHSVLPPHLTSKCEDKPVFWMEAFPAEGADARLKRSPRVCIRVCRNGVCYRRCWG